MRPHTKMSSVKLTVHQAPTGYDMELHFSDRDRVGVQDSVLLEDYENIEVFIDNLRKRHRADLIYTSIGHVLLSVNPYKPVPIYGEEVIKEYRRAGFVESAPHVFAVADYAYRSLTEERLPQCLLISGESGAGKTEASKRVLEFIAAASGHTADVETVKDKLLWSNPVLEAFGNAKTCKNDNSSRFGKFMNVTFDWEGHPTGGNILNYLLEKSRVVCQTPGERNFHIFYQILAGGDEKLLNSLGLVRERAAYAYLNHYNNSELDVDGERFNDVCHALDALQKSSDYQLFDREDMFKIVASVLHLGNVTFIEDEGVAKVVDDLSVNHIAKLLGCSTEDLIHALTHRTIEPQGEIVVSPLDAESAAYARDALAKAMYDRLFTWIVQQLNTSLTPTEPYRKEDGPNPGMGILDIYGFEVLAKNSFEQFCINLCNEKLQQLFIQLTLRQEQEEYLAEGIDWIPVKYDDNKEICDMIEEKPHGITALLDEERLLAKSTDLTFLAKINAKWAHQKYYFSHESSDIQTQKTMQRDEFRLVHYAGEVTYCVKTFLDKNVDLLYRDLCEVMTKTTNSITKAVFHDEEVHKKKRPDTTITKFKQSLNELMAILKNKQPSYIRCIRPNDIKAAGVFDENSVRHQVKYLGLMENLRIRRAGFAYRRSYEDFLQRYKCLSKHTWPNYKGPAKDGVQILVKDLGYSPDEYKMGKTKIFIRSPVTLFKTEDAFQSAKHRLATDIQKIWRGRKQRQEYLKMRRAVISIERIVRGFLGRREALRRRQAIVTIQKFIAGFLTRNGPVTDLNMKFLGIARAEWLKRLAKHLPKSVLDKSWPPCPVVCQEASVIVRKLYTSYLAGKYCRALTPEKKHAMDLKIIAEGLFKDKKKSYPASFPNWFKTDRVESEDREFLVSFIKSQINGEKIVYCTSVTKFDRHGYNPRRRVLIITDRNVHLVDPKTGKRKHQLPHKLITELSVTAYSDLFLRVEISKELRKDKGDLLLSVPHLIETITLFVDASKMGHIVSIKTEGEVPHHVIKGKDGKIQVTQAPVPSVAKSKEGKLVVSG